MRATSKQLKIINQIKREKGITHRQVNTFIQRLFSVDRLSNLSKTHATELISILRRYKVNK